MSDNVIKLVPKPDPLHDEIPEPTQKFINEAAVERAEKVLEALRTGEFVGFAYAAVHEDGDTVTGFDSCNSWTKLSAAVAYLQYRIMRWVDDEL